MVQPRPRSSSVGRLEPIPWPIAISRCCGVCRGRSLNRSNSRSFWPYGFSLPLDGGVAGPVHHGGEAVGGGSSWKGQHRARRAGRFFSSGCRCRGEAIGTTDVQAEGEVAVVGPDARGVIGVFGVEQADLAEHGVAVDEHLVFHAEVVVLEPAGAGDVDEEIGVFDQVARGRLPRAVEFAVGAVAINPAVAEAKAGHHLAQIIHVVGAILADRRRTGS
jgi:hypothetical protein